MAKESTPKAIYLKDYTPPSYWIDTSRLLFQLGEEETRVVTDLALHRNEDILGEHPLVLVGEDLILGQVHLDDRLLTDDDYEVDGDTLKIYQVPEKFNLRLETFIYPQNNTSLEGLYKSSGNYCTQCEAEGFRKITYYLDRPDVMSRFTTRIEADKSLYPVLLSNGNPVDSGDLDDGRHFVTWEDPFRKPCYLFALVAGNLKSVEETFTTMSGKQVDCRIYVEPHNLDKCEHAMRSLHKAMAWDEKTFGREYDLDIYMIVAVDDFNMGAMENKGLNVFNSKYVLSLPSTATDDDYIGIEGVIGHEYFHNWSGNRITCRDWFQLTLKEGFTVFRDQQFTADMNSASVKRIDDVNILRTHQFVEDAGPMSHPIQPDSYVEINNFYTLTVYNKGAEVIRMLHTLLGAENFRKGTDYYFEEFDGLAATTEDFIGSMENANFVCLEQFRRWYHQAGTPELRVESSWDQDAARFDLRIRQTSRDPEHKPFHIPVAVALIDAQGREVKGTNQVLELREQEQVFSFENISQPVVPSVLRNFSAPVKLVQNLTDEDYAFLMAHDTDEFNRWDAAQQLALKLLLQRIRGDAEADKLEQLYIDSLQKTLHAGVDLALKARMLALPSEKYISEQMDVVDVDAIHQSREDLRRRIGEVLQPNLLKVYRAHHSSEYSIDPASMGQRFLKNVCLSYLVNLNTAEYRQLALDQFALADNMTDQLAAFRCLADTQCAERETVIKAFYDKWNGDNLVMDKWFSVQALTSLPDTLDHIRDLKQHPDFNIRVPNRVRSLLGAFSQNQAVFHHASGEGYALLTETVMELNSLNPQIAARLVLPLIQWRRYDPQRQALMKQQLQRLVAMDDLARDIAEVVNRSLEE